MPLEHRIPNFRAFFRNLSTKQFDVRQSTYNFSSPLTCRRFHAETSPPLLPNTHLHFKSTERMVDCLSKFTSDQIRAIRSLRVKAFPFPLYASPDAFGYKTNDLSDVLSLFPGLQLNQLIVEDCFHDPDVNDGWGDGGTFMELRSLLRFDGWRELQFLSPTSEFIINSIESRRHTNAANVEELLREWKREMKNRDGEESGADVRLFVANEDQDVEKEESRTELVHKEELEGIQLQHSVLVVAKRGRHSDHVMKTEVYQEGDWRYEIHNLFSSMTWEEIKANELLLDGEDRPCIHL
ncbi:hypothetical protein BT69DRAFT_1356139 [Atractiella rhizophila]|nr:hypothetical protein BT69DRAFT_1356139 [Atractiella rhizophila]